MESTGSFFIPNIFIEKIMLTLNEAEVKIMTAFFRYVYESTNINKDSSLINEKLSLSLDFLIQKLNIKKNLASKAISSLIKKGLIFTEKQNSYCLSVEIYENKEVSQ